MSCECGELTFVIFVSLRKKTMKTGQLIKSLRLKKGITQEELSAKTDISVRTIQRIENGEVDARAFTLQTIAAALEVDYEMLAGSELNSAETEKKESVKWRALLHLSGLLLLIVPPILIWIWKRDGVKSISRDGVDVINYQLSMTLYLLPLAMLSVYPILLVLAIYSQVMIIINTIKVTREQPYKYPLTIRFLKHDYQESKAASLA